MSVFMTEIFNQPDVMIETAESVKAQLTQLSEAMRHAKRIIFTGMGSSSSAVYPSLLRLTAGGIDVRSIEASELLYYQTQAITSETLIIVISQSGRSAEITPLLELARQKQASVLGITNTPDSPLHQQSPASLVMRAGTEATVATKTYTCTLTLLHLLTSWFLQEDLDDALHALTSLAHVIREHLPSWHLQMTTQADRWTRTGFIEYLGRGSSMASATTAALISKESIKIPTESMNAGQFRHGPIELVDEHFTGMLFIGSEPTRQFNRGLAEEIVRHGGQLVLISQIDLAIKGTEWVIMPECSPALLPFAEIIPVQLFCGEMSTRRGYEAGQFRYIAKVTIQE